MTLNAVMKEVVKSATPAQRIIPMGDRLQFLVTEVGELIKENLTSYYKTQDGYAYKERMAEELCDVIWNCCMIADKLGLDLDDEMGAMIARHKERFPRMRSVCTDA